MAKRGRKQEDKELKRAICRAIRGVVGAERGRQSKIARSVGLDRRQINQYCQGNHRPNDRNLLKICDELGITEIPYKGINYLAGLRQASQHLQRVPYQPNLFGQLKASEKGMDIQVKKGTAGSIQLVVTIPKSKISA